MHLTRAVEGISEVMEPYGTSMLTDAHNGTHDMPDHFIACLQTFSWSTHQCTHGQARQSSSLFWYCSRSFAHASRFRAADVYEAWFRHRIMRTSKPTHT